MAIYAVVLAFGATLFTGNFPGLPGHYTSNVEVNGHPYYLDLYEIPFPQFGNNSTPPADVLFHNVTFWIWVTGWYSAEGGYVHGNGTEANGTTYPFLLGGLLSDPDRATLFVSPDTEFAVGWSGELFLELLVKV